MTAAGRLFSGSGAARGHRGARTGHLRGWRACHCRPTPGHRADTWPKTRRLPSRDTSDPGGRGVGGGSGAAIWGAKEPAGPRTPGAGGSDVSRTRVPEQRGPGDPEESLAVPGKAAAPGRGARGSLAAPSGKRPRNLRAVGQRRGHPATAPRARGRVGRGLARTLGGWRREAAAGDGGSAPREPGCRGAAGRGPERGARLWGAPHRLRRRYPAGFGASLRLLQGHGQRGRRGACGLGQGVPGRGVREVSRPAPPLRAGTPHPNSAGVCGENVPRPCHLPDIASHPWISRLGPRTAPESSNGERVRWGFAARVGAGAGRGRRGRPTRWKQQICKGRAC